MNRRTLKRLILFFIFLPCTVAMSQSVSDIVDLIREGHTRLARDMLLRIKNDIPPERALFLYGLVSINADSALTSYEDLLKTYPESQYSDRALFRIAQLKYSQGLYKTAQHKYLQLLNQYPRSSLHQSCYFWLGFCHQAMGQTDSAIVYLQRAVDDFPHTELSEIAQRDLWAFTEQGSNDIQESPNAPNRRWAIQVYAFTEQNRALLRKSFFEQEGYHVDLRTKRTDGTTFYLVWVGSFKSREEAKQFGEMFKKRYDVKNYILVSE